MGSRMAITEKKPTKGKGLGSVFFHFFDWNKMLSNKKKKLFSSNKLLLPSGSKKFGGDEKMPRLKQFLVTDDNLESFPISQKQNFQSNQMQDPGPIAKLMGLESMPIVHHKKPSKPSLASDFGSGRYETSEVKDTRPQKLQRTGGFMERQQKPFSSSSETVNSNRRARRQYHHKLASPVKSPRLLSKRGSNRLMEAATRILEPGLQSRRNHAKCTLTYSTGCSSQSDEKVSKDGVFMKKYKISSNDPFVSSSRSFTSLSETKDSENKMKPLEKRTLLSPFSQDRLESKRSLVLPLGKDKPKSIDVQPKCMQDEHDRNIFRQNALPPVRGKLACGPSVHNAKSNRRDFVPSDSGLSSCKHSTTLVSKLGRERLGIDQNRLERKNKAHKRRPNDDSLSESGKVVNFTINKQQSARGSLVKGKGIIGNNSTNLNSVKSEFKRRVDGNGASSFEGNAIVSFTFNSPMKHARRSSSNNIEDKRRCKGKPSYNASLPKKLVSTETTVHSMASQKEETLCGDSLSTLLERKIEELNSLDCDEFLPGNASEERCTASILGELISALTFKQEDALSCGFTDTSDRIVSDGDMVKTNEKSQAEEDVNISSAYTVSSDHPSPVSILDVSFSNDSCFSGSPNGSSGHKPDFGSSGTCNNIPSLEDTELLEDTEILDSASSFDVEKFDFLEKNSVIKDSFDLHDIWFSESKPSSSTEAKSNAKLLIENISLPSSNAKDSFIYDTLEAIAKDLKVTDCKDGKQLRDLLIDCIIECLDSQFICFYRPGSNLSLLMRGERLSRVIRDETERWNSSRGKMMDDIVENDISHSNGMWTNFETESFETGVQIGDDIVNELVGEFVIDLLI
ncbi:uncharacterized protein A4U43_C01F32240 [Asparagus officinalis]|uniref:DUF4378 domain-containing protein n=1 Tax=Asparagus officinalis TaxID=4686 RepID=A0A5P1FUR6_ASPOF|nr:uncharacterized protein LOC109828522 [Asparagus officinalis]ONK81724.1 uncharacterized protein A4U43_C01F32240 [Asparagus officinalis]